MRGFTAEVPVSEVQVFVRVRQILPPASVTCSVSGSPSFQSPADENTVCVVVCKGSVIAEEVTNPAEFCVTEYFQMDVLTPSNTVCCVKPGASFDGPALADGKL